MVTVLVQSNMQSVYIKTVLTGLGESCHYLSPLYGTTLGTKKDCRCLNLAGK